MRGEEAVLEAMLGGCEETELDVKLAWREALGAPGAVVVKNHRLPQGAKMLGRCWASGRR